MGSDDANGDACIMSSNGSCLGIGFSSDFFENKGVVVEAAPLSFLSRLSRDASRSFLCRGA
jgi:hypothetical protein